MSKKIQRQHNGLLTASEAGELLGVSSMTVLRLVREGHLRPKEQSGLVRKRRLFLRSDVVELKKNYA